MVSALNPNPVSWQEKCKLFFTKEKQDWQQSSLYKKFELIFSIIFAVVVFFAIMYLAFHSLMADISGSGGM